MIGIILKWVAIVLGIIIVLALLFILGLFILMRRGTKTIPAKFHFQSDIMTGEQLMTNRN